MAPKPKELPRSYKFPGITSSPCNSCSFDSASYAGNGWECSFYGNSQKASQSIKKYQKASKMPKHLPVKHIESIKQSLLGIPGCITCRDSMFSQKISYNYNNSNLIELHTACYWYCQCLPHVDLRIVLEEVPSWPVLCGTPRYERREGLSWVAGGESAWIK